MREGKVYVYIHVYGRALLVTNNNILTCTQEPQKFKCCLASYSLLPALLLILLLNILHMNLEVLHKFQRNVHRNLGHWCIHTLHIP